MRRDFFRLGIFYQFPRTADEGSVPNELQGLFVIIIRDESLHMNHRNDRFAIRTNKNVEKYRQTVTPP